MATLALDLPETPQAQAAYRLAADCPCCRAPLVLRQNRQTGALFTGCSAYPRCAFTEPHDSRVQTLSACVVQAVQTLATQVVQVQTEARRQVAQAQAAAQREVAAERATLDHTVRQLIALAHPDRWPDIPLAHELTVALVALRETLRPGNQVATPAGQYARRLRSARSPLGASASMPSHVA
jgi:ssDNA-binding Zn-finger/Zn-ribbon topoisomerase 1